MKNEVNKTGKKLVIISALILTTIMCIAFIAGVTAVTDTTSVDPASLSLSLFKKKTDATPTTSITGNAVDDFGNTIATVTIKANEEVGRVNDYFYGVNTGGKWLKSNATINHGSQKSDLNWHREAFLQGGYSFSREDMNLASFYNNGTGNWSILRKGDTTSITQEYEWARQNGVKILNIIDYMPEWLGDNSSGSCLEMKFCPPLNHTYFGELVKDYINRTTLNGEYLDVVEYEFWNEPDIFFFMGGLSSDNEIKSIEINKMFNTTATKIRQDYPHAIIGGLGLANCYSSNLRNNFLGNFSNPNELNFSNFFSCHNYIPILSSPSNIYIVTQTKLNNIYNNCSIRGGEETCKSIYLSEFNLAHSTTDDWIKNTSSRANEYSANYGLFYMASLNSYPENVAMMTYQWADSVVYGPEYPEYPHQWYSVQEPALGLEYKPPYNVTKDFAHYHAGGNMIVNSSSNNESIKSVASLNPKGIWHITVINTATNNISVNVDVSSTGVRAVKDLATGTIYPVSNGIANVGILTKYDVKHYEGIANYEVEGDTPVSDVSSSSDKGNKVVSVKNLNVNPNEFTAIETGTSKVISTSDIFVYTNTNTNNQNKKEEIEEFYGPIQSEEAINEIDYKSRTGSLSLAVSNKNYLTIVIILLGSIICTAIIISIIYRKKKREADKVKKLMDWVDKARTLGYSNDKMKEMLAQYNWDKDLVEKVVGK